MSYSLPNPATPDQQQAVAIIILLTSSLTIICTTSFFVYLIRNPKLYNFEVFMIMMIILGDFITASAIGFPTAILWNMDYNQEYYNSFWCMASAFFRQFGTLLEFFWSLNIVLTAYYSFDGETQRTSKIILGFTGPFLLSMIKSPAIKSLNGSAYGPSAFPVPGPQPGEFIQLNSSFCFLNTGVEFPLSTNLMFIFTFEAPIVLIMIIVTYLFVKILIRIKNEFSTKLQTKFYFRLLTYPFILFITQIWFMVIIIVNMFQIVGAYDFQILCYTMCNIAGILDCLAYGYSLFDLKDNTALNSELQLGNSLQEKSK